MDYINPQPLLFLYEFKPRNFIKLNIKNFESENHQKESEKDRTVRSLMIIRSKVLRL